MSRFALYSRAASRTSSARATRHGPNNPAEAVTIAPPAGEQSVEKKQSHSRNQEELKAGCLSTASFDRSLNPTQLHESPPHLGCLVGLGGVDEGAGGPLGRRAQHLWMILRDDHIAFGV